jgi:uncharacterized protein
MTGFDALLHLQDLDTSLDQLRHRHEHLPERAEVTANAAARVALDHDLTQVQAERDDLARNQKRIEDEVATVESKATEVHATLYSGTVKAPKELQALQDDHDSLKRRQTTLEDQVIEVMEAVEPVDARLAELSAEQVRLAAEAARVAAALADADTAVLAEIDRVQAERDAAVADVPADLLGEYEKLRPQFGGIAVARLVGANCQGCHLSLSAMALDQVRNLPPDALAHCDECGRMLVH